MTNWIDLEGLANLRDLGGLPTTDGAAIRPGRLLRSDNLQTLTGRDVAELRQRGLTDVIDLRSSVETLAEGPGPLTREDWVTVHHFSFFRETPATGDRDNPATAGRDNPATAGRDNP
ncbi:tyrosine-protein phosphatase, partial [Nakamurella lactea]|uniref:tyrosine-protein phosphatase n=1 Tax=Nakamurella lactea TaxID=459515 RepID=UPI00137829E7